MNTVDNLRYHGQLPTPISKIYPIGAIPFGTHVAITPQQPARYRLSIGEQPEYPYTGTVIGIFQQIAGYVIKREDGRVNYYVPTDEVCTIQTDYQI